MKKLTILLFSILISFSSYGELVKVAKGVSANHYIDKETIKEHGGYVYWWELMDLLEPNQYGDMSSELYNQGDCGMNRFNVLSYIFYKQPMSGGTGETYNPSKEWKYPSPRSVGGIKLKWVCDYVD